MTWRWDGSELPEMPVIECVGSIDKGVTKKRMWVGLNDHGEKVVVKPMRTPANQAMMDELKPGLSRDEDGDDARRRQSGDSAPLARQRRDSVRDIESGLASVREDNAADPAVRYCVQQPRISAKLGQPGSFDGSYLTRGSGLVISFFFLTSSVAPSVANSARTLASI